MFDANASRNIVVGTTNHWQQANSYAGNTLRNNSNLYTPKPLQSKNERIYEASKQEHESKLSEIPIYLSPDKPLKERIKRASDSNCDLLIKLNRKIALLAFAGMFDDCMQEINKIKAEGLIPDAYSYNPVISLLIRGNKPNNALLLVKEMQNDCIPSDIITCNQLMNLFKSQGDRKAATILLGEMHTYGILPNITTYNHLMKLYVHKKDLKNAKEVLRKMHLEGVQPDVDIYIALMKLYANPMDLLKEVDGKADTAIYNALLKFYILDGNLPGAKDVLMMMNGTGQNPDIDTYNILLKCYEKNGNHVQKMHTILEEMRERNIKPNKITYTIVTQFCIKKGTEEESIELLKELQRSGVLGGIISCNILMHYFKKHGDRKKVGVLFKDMYQQGAIPYAATYNHLMDSYLNNGNLDPKKIHYMEAKNRFGRIFPQNCGPFIEDREISMEVFDEMQLAEILPKNITFDSLIIGEIKGCKKLFRFHKCIK